MKPKIQKSCGNCRFEDYFTYDYPCHTCKGWENKGYPGWQPDKETQLKMEEGEKDDKRI